MERTLRVLHVEDSERDKKLIALHLSRAGYQVVSERVESPEAMKAALESQEWDVIFCDYSMPRFNALSALALTKEMRLDIPFIMISGAIGEAAAVEGMRSGAQDYLMKDNLARLAPIIEREVHEAHNRRARRQAEEEKTQLTARVENQGQRLDTIVASVPGVVWEAWGKPDAATQRINFVSNYVETMVGYSREEWLSTPNFWLSIVHPDDKDQAGSDAAEDFAGGKSRNVREFRWVAKDGRVLWVQAISAVIRDDEGKSVGMRGVTVDITERKHAEAALRESDVRYRLLFEGNPLPMWVYDLETLAFLAVNDAAILHYGRSRKEFLSMTIKEIRLPEDIPALLENVANVASDMSEACVSKHRLKDGTTIDVEITSHELVFAGRRAELVLAKDVTEQRQAEAAQARRATQAALRADVNAALAESNISLQEILEHSTKALVKHLDAAFGRIWTLNREENVLELQASAGLYTHINGAHARVPVGAYKIGLIAAERRAHITNDVQHDSWVSDKEWAKEEGMIAFAGYPLLVEDRLVGVIAMFARQQLAEDTLDALASVADIISQGIERKRAEEALLASENLLRQSQKLEAVGQLAGGIAHDFNNLLTVITGYSEIVLMRIDKNDPLHQNIEEIKKAGERAASLTRQLLAFSRKQVLQPKILTLNAIVSEIDKMLRRLIGEDIEVLTVLDPSLGQVRADPGQLEQVIINLAVNARDAMPQGGKITIETSNVFLDNKYARKHTAVRSGNYVMLALSDTGTGMGSETQAHMFEPFFTTKPQGKGTGLGLSTVYGIVKQSEGNIWVYSEIGIGTTFKVYLPRIDEVAQIDAVPDGLTKLSRGRETVLLAEDEEPVRRLTKMILEMSGYRVLEAASGGEALAIFERHQGQIDLIVTDVVMPKMSGPELAQGLATLCPGIKVLYLSGYTDDAVVRHGLLDQGMAFLQKPFTPALLTRKVREVLDGA